MNELVMMSRELYDGVDVLNSLSEGMVICFVCHNAQTKEFHCENDCSYTLISVPHTSGKLCNEGEFVFQFKCDDKRLLQICLSPGTVLYYTGFGIMHRQISLLDKGEDRKHYDFWNVSSYGNHALLSKTIASFCL